MGVRQVYFKVKIKKLQYVSCLAIDRGLVWLSLARREELAAVVVVGGKKLNCTVESDTEQPAAH